jgi:hypothetical protein
LRPVHLCRAPISDEAIAALHASVGRVATLTPADCHRILVALVDWYERENEQATDAPLNVEALAIFAYNEGRCSR